MNCECWHFSKSQTPYRNTQSISVGLQKYKLSISVGVRSTQVLATTHTFDVKTGHGTKALIWGMMWEVEKMKIQAGTLQFSEKQTPPYISTVDPGTSCCKFSLLFTTDWKQSGFNLLWRQYKTVWHFRWKYGEALWHKFETLQNHWSLHQNKQDSCTN